MEDIRIGRKLSPAFRFFALGGADPNPCQIILPDPLRVSFTLAVVTSQDVIFYWDAVANAGQFWRTYDVKVNWRTFDLANYGQQIWKSVWAYVPAGAADISIQTVRLNDQ